MPNYTDVPRWNVERKLHALVADSREQSQSFLTDSALANGVLIVPPSRRRPPTAAAAAAFATAFAGDAFFGITANAFHCAA